MSYHFKGAVLALCIIISNFLSFGQDVEYSQYYAAELYLNPALIGFETQTSLGAIHRNQWNNISNPFTSSQVGFIMPMWDKDGLIRWGGIGVSAYNNVSADGNYTTGGASASVAMNAILSQYSFMSAGILVGVGQKQASFNNFNWSSQYESVLGFNPSLSNGTLTLNETILSPEIAVGVLYGYNMDFHGEATGTGFFIGQSFYHLAGVNDGFSAGETQKLPILSKTTAGVVHTLGERSELAPNLLFNAQGSNYQCNLGIYYSYRFGAENGVNWIPNKVVLGSWYRFGDSFIGLMGIESNAYAIGFSYDTNASTLRSDGFASSAYEISLRLMKPDKKHKKIHSPRM